MWMTMMVTLPPEMVKEGRMNEMQGFEPRQIYTICQRSECTDEGLHPIGVRWVDVAKNGAARSRLVAQYFNNSKVDIELISPTPSPPSSRWLVSELASQGGGRVGGKRPMCIDFTQEFLHGCVDLDVYTELPDEDARKKRGLIARLNKAMYGLHEAPLIWQRMVRNTMRKLAFQAPTTAQCVCYHLARRVTVVAHVDDFLCVASKEELENLLRQLQS